MNNRERKDMIGRMVTLAKVNRKVAFDNRWDYTVWTLADIKGEARGFMRAARMLKGYATQARFKTLARRAA